MNTTVKTTVKSTMTVIAAMSFVVACGSKKNAPAAPGEVTPTAVKTLFPGDFKGESLTCTDNGKISDKSVYFVGTTLSFTADKQFTKSEESERGGVTEKGTVSVTDEKKGEMTFSTITEIEVDGNEKKDVKKAEFTFDGDTLIVTQENADFCPADKKAVMIYKRYVKPEAPAATTPAPAAQTPAAQAPATSPEGDKAQGQDSSKPAEQSASVETAQK